MSPAPLPSPHKCYFVSCLSPRNTASVQPVRSALGSPHGGGLCGGRRCRRTAPLASREDAGSCLSKPKHPSWGCGELGVGAPTDPAPSASHRQLQLQQRGLWLQTASFHLLGKLFKATPGTLIQESFSFLQRAEKLPRQETKVPERHRSPSVHPKGW